MQRRGMLPLSPQREPWVGVTRWDKWCALTPEQLTETEMTAGHFA